MSCLTYRDYRILLRHFDKPIDLNLLKVRLKEIGVYNDV